MQAWLISTSVCPLTWLEAALGFIMVSCSAQVVMFVLICMLCLAAQHGTSTCCQLSGQLVFPPLIGKSTSTRTSCRLQLVSADTGKSIGITCLSTTARILALSAAISALNSSSCAVAACLAANIALPVFMSANPSGAPEHSQASVWTSTCYIRRTTSLSYLEA